MENHEGTKTRRNTKGRENALGLSANLVFLIPFFLAGCGAQLRAPGVDAASRAIACGLNPPRVDRDVQAWVVPPVGWVAQPLKISARHTHRVWVSPTGSTAYGVIHVNLPFPVGSELTLWGFLQEMQRVEGHADLINKQNDDTLPGMRFVAQGRIYTVRTNLIVSGFEAWAVYAGTLTGKPVNLGELELATCAREQTRVGMGNAEECNAQHSTLNAQH